MRGKSLLDLLWEQLDQFVDEYQEMTDGGFLEEAVAEARGRAHAAAVCVALVTNPYSPQVDAIKAEAMERWEQRQDEPTEPVRKPNERTAVTTNGGIVRPTLAERRAARLARRAARNS